MVSISSGTCAQRHNKTESLSIIVDRDAQTFFGRQLSFRCFQSDGEFILYALLKFDAQIILCTIDNIFTTAYALLKIFYY